MLNPISLNIDNNHSIAANEVHSTLQKHILADGFEFVLDLQNSKGSVIIDAKSGKKYIDFFTFFASNPIGMNHSKMDTPEFISKIGKIALNKPSCSDIYTIEMAEFVDTFFRIAVPDNFKYSFFIEGGALANENAMKAAFDWKVKKNFQKGYTEEKGHKVIYFQHSFHGRSGYTLSLTNTDPVKTKHYPKFNDWIKISSPKIVFPMTEANLADLILRESQAIDEIRTAFEQNKDEVACVIIEPIQSEGGDNHFRPEFLANLKNLCLQNEALLIFDEVQTGIGMTGEMWASQSLGVIPDMITFGKKMQVCGFIATDRIDDVADNVFHSPSRINSTWGGNIVDMVRVQKYLEIIDEENLVENSKVMGKFLLSELSNLQAEFPNLISQARGRGLLCAFDLPSTELRNSFKNKCYEKGLIILGCGERSIRFRTALNVTKETLESGLDIIRQVLLEL